MEAEIIREKSAELPKVPLSRIADASEVWEGDDGGAHFTLLRQDSYSPSIPEHYVLTLKGNGPDIDRLIDEFSEVFGQPNVVSFNPYVDFDMIAEFYPDVNRDIVMVEWDVEQLV